MPGSRIPCCQRWLELAVLGWRAERRTHKGGIASCDFGRASLEAADVDCPRRTRRRDPVTAMSLITSKSPRSLRTRGQRMPPTARRPSAFHLLRWWCWRGRTRLRTTSLAVWRRGGASLQRRPVVSLCLVSAHRVHAEAPEPADPRTQVRRLPRAVHNTRGDTYAPLRPHAWYQSPPVPAHDVRRERAGEREHVAVVTAVPCRSGE